MASLAKSVTVSSSCWHVITYSDIPVLACKCHRTELCLSGTNAYLLSIGDTTNLWTLLTLLLILFFALGGTYLIFRHWRLSRDMDVLLWRIDKKDISWESGQICPFVGGRMGAGSQASLARFSTMYAPLVQYRERHFAAKGVPLGQLDANMKIQLKLVRKRGLGICQTNFANR